MFLNQVLELEKISVKPLKVYLHGFYSLSLRMRYCDVHRMRQLPHFFPLLPAHPREKKIKGKINSKKPSW